MKLYPPGLNMDSPVLLIDKNFHQINYAFLLPKGGSLYDYDKEMIKGGGQCPCFSSEARILPIILSLTIFPRNINFINFQI